MAGLDQLLARVRVVLLLLLCEAIARGEAAALLVYSDGYFYTPDYKYRTPWWGALLLLLGLVSVVIALVMCFCNCLGACCDCCCPPRTVKVVHERSPV
ncbi:unnamed protein product [Closterium sp. Yama58-4]|nr:unnamed protein product [Closterium sp. Yama58-4]